MCLGRNVIFSVMATCNVDAETREPVIETADDAIGANDSTDVAPTCAASQRKKPRSDRMESFGGMYEDFAVLSDVTMVQLKLAVMNERVKILMKCEQKLVAWVGHDAMLPGAGNTELPDNGMEQLHALNVLMRAHHVAECENGLTLLAHYESVWGPAAALAAVSGNTVEASSFIANLHNYSPRGKPAHNASDVNAYFFNRLNWCALRMRSAVSINEALICAERISFLELTLLLANSVNPVVE